MMPRFSDFDLDAEFVFDRMLDDDTLDAFQRLLVSMAPKWAAGLQVRLSPREQWPLNASDPAAVRSAALRAATQRGPTYAALAERCGEPASPRAFGSIELRGTSPELVVVVSIDAMVSSQVGPALRLGNGISLQVRRNKVDGVIGKSWLHRSFETIGASLSPAWGYAANPGEYWRKVMSDPPRVQAIGRDFGRFLPGVFWRNFFGSQYCELIGAGRVASLSEATTVLRSDGGFMCAIDLPPTDWASPEYMHAEQRIRDILGAELFFSKDEPERLTIAPVWP